VSAGLYVDTVNAQGGSTMTVGGTLTNNAQLEIGNTNLSSNASVTTSGLVNNGYVQLEGSSTAQASLVVHAPATDPLTGTYSLSGNSAVVFDSGTITTINGSVTLNGPKAYIEDKTATGSTAP
jgi:hypothetical protein